jgi:hypothetical protein
MPTIDLECPNCGRGGTVSAEKAHSRLVCRKCHMVFHMNQSGRTVLGEPPVESIRGDRSGTQTAESKAKARKAVEFNLPEVTTTHLLTLAGILLLAGAVYGFMTWGGPSDNLQARAQTLVDALAKNDIEGVKASAASGQSDDAVRFYENARQKLEPLRKLPGGETLLTSVLVVEMSPNSKKGQVVGIFVPSKGSERNEKVAREAGIDKSTVELNLFWVTDGFGRWRLDATKSIGG